VPKAFSGQDNATQLAIHALSFLAADPERLGPFLALTGVDPTRIREAARSSGFLAAVLDHVCANGDLLAAFSAEAGRRPEDVDRARQVLAGPLPDGLRDA
jgi:hypothetical protein